MSTEEQIKAAIVVTPDAIAFVSPEMNHASEHLGRQMCFFVDFVQSLEPRLQRFEATELAAAFVESFPSMCEQNPEVIDCLKENAELLIKRRISKKLSAIDPF